MSDSPTHPTIFRSGMTRRDFLRNAGLGALALPAASVLAACGVKGEPEAKPTVRGLTQLPPAAGEVSVANWELYIDPKVWRRYGKDTGTKITYKESIIDNETFFGTIQPLLAAGKPIGYDVIVVSDWLIAKMARLGYLLPLHHDRLTNFAAQAGAVYKDPEYDPGNQYSIPWQAGITGIAYNQRLTKRPITRFEELFNPAFKNKVGMMTEMRDTVNMTLLNLGVTDIQKATTDDAQRAVDKLKRQLDAGIVRDYYDNGYVDALANGDLAVTLAWSGDVLQLTLDDPDIRFVVPEEGGILWVDCMCIPRDAEHPTDAHEWMNYVYNPRVAATITEWVNYVTPVPAAKGIILADAAKLTGEDRAFYQGIAASELIFPSSASEGRLHTYKLLPEAEEKVWNEMFQTVSEG